MSSEPEGRDDDPRARDDADERDPNERSGDRLQEARDKIAAAENSDDDKRLEVLEEVRSALEAELDTSVENGSARH